VIRAAAGVPYLPAREPRELVFETVQCPVCLRHATAFDVTDGLPVDELRAALHDDRCLTLYSEVVK
jgi:hypothetical protein